MSGPPSSRDKIFSSIVNCWSSEPIKPLKSTEAPTGVADWLILKVLVNLVKVKSTSSLVSSVSWSSTIWSAINAVLFEIFNCMPSVICNGLAGVPLPVMVISSPIAPIRSPASPHLTIPFSSVTNTWPGIKLAISVGAILPSRISSEPTAFWRISLEPTDSAASFSWVILLSCISSGPIPPSTILSPSIPFLAISKL